VKPWAYYNEWDEYAAHRLRQNIAQGLIMPGYVDLRSIKDVMPDDLECFTQVHFFAGLGLWSYSARRAGWPDTRPFWTGSCPCQPFSAAGKQGGTDDPRHLWPDMFRLIRARRPAEVMGEQVAGSLGYGWFDGVRSDLEGEGYASRAVDFPACSIDAPHIRNRLYWVAKRMAQSNSSERDGRSIEPQRSAEERTAVGRTDAAGNVADSDGDGYRAGTGGHDSQEATAFGRVTLGDAQRAGLEGHARHGDGGGGWPITAGSTSSPDGRNGSFWSGAKWIICHDGKARRTQPGLRLLVDGYTNRISDWRATGNAIVPEAAIQVIAAYLETEAANAA
jgi:DNA (cytosine-5)-methyltransferase 1